MAGSRCQDCKGIWLAFQTAHSPDLHPLLVDARGSNCKQNILNNFWINLEKGKDNILTIFSDEFVLKTVVTSNYYRLALVMFALHFPYY